ncbi:MAG: hypothetical protein AB7F39_19590 [Variibacter sp.]
MNQTLAGPLDRRLLLPGDGHATDPDQGGPLAPPYLIHPAGDPVTGNAGYLRMTDGKSRRDAALMPYSTALNQIRRSSYCLIV